MTRPNSALEKISVVPSAARKLIVCAGIMLSWQSAKAQTIPAVAGYENTYFLSASGALQATGFNHNGQLGIGDFFSRSLFQTVSSPMSVTDVWANQKVTYLRRSDGSLWACGYGHFGLLGDSSLNSTRNAFLQVGLDSDWRTVSLGVGHVIALKDDGTLWAWGRGVSGELGDVGSGFYKTVPTQSGTASDWLMVAAGGNHNLAIKTDGSLWVWGNNGQGQLGINSTTNSSVPVQVGAHLGWKSISAGASHSLAVRNDGSLWTWGQNSSGQLGDGSTTPRTVPTRVGSGTQWDLVKAGESHSLGRLTDGTLFAWGENGSGQLGLGDTVQRNSPVTVVAGTTWSAVGAGKSHSAAVRSDGKRMVWGGNIYGQLGPEDAMVTLPIEADFIPRPELAASSSSTATYSNELVQNGSGSVSLPLTAEGVAKSATVKVFNHGSAPLDISSVNVPAGFSVMPAGPVTLAPGAGQTFAVSNSSTVTGILAGNLTVLSNDANDGDFRFMLSSNVLSHQTDSDGDGVNDAAEWHLASLGFRWNSANPTLAAALVAGSRRLGKMPASELAAAAPGSTLVRTHTGENSASFLLRLERASDTLEFARTGLSASNLPGDGSIVVPLVPGDPSGFFRFAVEPSNLSQP